MIVHERMQALVVWLRNNGDWVVLSMIVSCLYLYLALPTVFWGPYNPDEGWYLMSAWRTWSGDVPYRDFAFPQTPLALYVHGLWQKLLGPSFYLGRVVNAVLGLAVVYGTMTTGKRLHSAGAGVLAGLLLASQPWFVLQMVSVSTYALAAVLLVLFTYCVVTRRWWWVGFVSVAAVWTRLTLIPFMPPLLLGCSYVSWPQHWRTTTRLLLAGLGVGLLVLVAPFIVALPEPTYTHVVDYHVYTRHALLEDSPVRSVDAIWEYLRTDYWYRYRVLIIMALGGLLTVFTSKQSTSRQVRLIMSLLTFATVATAAAHVVTYNVTYDVPLMPILALVGSVGLMAGVSGIPSHVLRRVALTTLCATAAFSSFWPQLPLFYGVGEVEASHQQVQRVAAYIKAHSQPTDWIFTPELYIALEAQRASLPGTDLGRFFYFPELSEDDARKRGGMNETMLQEAIAARQATFIIFSATHHWQNFPQTAEAGVALEQRIVEAGYRLVPSLHEQQPVIENLRIYERQ